MSLQTLSITYYNLYLREKQDAIFNTFEQIDAFLRLGIEMARKSRYNEEENKDSVETVMPSLCSACYENPVS